MKNEVTSKDGLGAGIAGLGVMYMVYPWAASEIQGDAAFGMLAGLCLLAGFLTILCGIAVMRLKNVNA